ncbi:MAG: 3-dehydroquinate dehydratase [Ignavibacteriaceae bacterium]|nr:3-dehydroquinate dehydratase [Ignavibacteriaceae bacterium]
MKFIIINGPNLNMLEDREKDQYGNFSLWDIENILKKEFPKVSVTFYQSNLEGDLVTKIHEANKVYDGLIINPGGYAHTSVAIHDALALCKIPKVEVHLSNISRREDFRQKTLTAKQCNGYISGLKEISYLSGVYSLIKVIENY